MKISPISSYQIKPLNIKQTKNNQKTNPAFKGFYPEVYTTYCEKHPDFVYKVPDVIFKKMDMFHESYSFLDGIRSSLTSSQTRKLPEGDNSERIGFINDKVKLVEQGPDNFGYPPHFATEKATVFDENLNKTVEIDFKLPSRAGKSGGILERTEYYPQSNIPEYKITSGIAPVPWRDYKISHYSPQGVVDKEYKVKDSLMGNSKLSVKDVITNKTEEFPLSK